MEVNPSDIKEGQVFYAHCINSQFPEFKKFKAVKATAKQVKARSLNRDGSLSYERAINQSNWRFFSDFESARDAWVTLKLDKDIKNAESNLERATRFKKEMLEKDDI